MNINIEPTTKAVLWITNSEMEDIIAIPIIMVIIEVKIIRIIIMLDISRLT